MFRFAHSEYLYFLSSIPLLALWLWHVRRRQQHLAARLGQPAIIRRLMPQVSEWKWRFKHGLRLLALALLIIGWANPQWGTRRQEVKARGVDLIFALDISQSMWATDIPPDRMARAKRMAAQLLDALPGNRIGIVLFAWEAFLQMPLTHDYAAAHLMLRAADPSLTLAQGTSIAEAVRLALRALPDTDHHKVLVLFSDGEDHDEAAIEAVRKAREQGLIVFTVGVGTPQGGLIPLPDRSDYKRDRTGQPVRSHLNEELLRALARAGDGRYFHILEADALADAIRRRIDALEKQEYESRLFSEYASYFQYFIGAALFLLLVEFFTSFRKTPWWQKQNAA